MTVKLNTLSALSALVFFALGASPCVAQGAAKVTLDQAVEQVQQQTGGIVLSAEQRHVGRMLEYRIKVLAPDGHVRVVAVSSKGANAQASNQTIKRSADRGRTHKEKH